MMFSGIVLGFGFVAAVLSLIGIIVISTMFIGQVPDHITPFIKLVIVSITAQMMIAAAVCFSAAKYLGAMS